MKFNLDLMAIENVLKAEQLNVKGALVMSVVSRHPLNGETLFVLPLEDSAQSPNELSGVDMSQYSPERFGVIIGLRASGDADGAVATKRLYELRELIKSKLIGLIIGNFEPIEYQAGRLIEINAQTHNVFYQLQFGTAHTVTSEVRNAPNT